MFMRRRHSYSETAERIASCWDILLRGVDQHMDIPSTCKISMFEEDKVLAIFTRCRSKSQEALQVLFPCIHPEFLPGPTPIRLSAHDRRTQILGSLAGSSDHTQTSYVGINGDDSVKPKIHG